MPKRTRHNPFRGVIDVMGEMARMSDQAASPDVPETQARTHVDAWNPTTDVFASGEDLVICIELAGVFPEDLEVNLSHSVLTVFGERRSERGEQDVFYIRERSWGRFRRTITVPEKVRDEHITAHLAEGVLTVTVRGAAEAPETTKIRVRHDPR